VIKVLEKYPEARNSDKRLWINFLETFYQQELYLAKNGKLYLELEKIMTLPSEQDLGRVRRKIQEPTMEYPYGLYLPADPEVRRRRRISEEAWRLWALNENSIMQKI
jgi:hypothetical protein